MARSRVEPRGSQLPRNDGYRQPRDRLGAGAARMTPDKPFFIYFAPARRMRRTRCPRSGSTSSRGSSTRAGTNTARRRSRGRTNSASSRPARSSRQGRRRSRIGKSCPPIEKGFRPPNGSVRRLRRADGLRDRPPAEALQKMGVADNTLVFYIVGDNGASAEGGIGGMLNEMTVVQRRAPRRSRTC